MEPTQPQPLATWNSARDVWETPGTEGFFCEHLDVYSETFPTSGMTVNGAAYALPTWGGATPDTGSSSLLPTVTVQDASNTGGPSQFDRNTPPLNTRVMMLPTSSANLGENGGSQHPDKRRAGNHQASIQDVAEHLLLPRETGTSATQPHGGPTLLPTPTVGMMMGGSATRSGARSDEKLLPGVAKDLALLPTTRAQHGEERNSNIYPRPLDQPQNLENALARLPGENTNPPSAAGNSPSDVQLPGQLSLLDAMADTD